MPSKKPTPRKPRKKAHRRATGKKPTELTVKGTLVCDPETDPVHCPKKFVGTFSIFYGDKCFQPILRIDGRPVKAKDLGKIRLIVQGTRGGE
jgi:hypothetical protein